MDDKLNKVLQVLEAASDALSRAIPPNDLCGFKLKQHHKAQRLVNRTIGELRAMQIVETPVGLFAVPDKAVQAQVVPEGWKLVPTNPTPEMMQAGFDIPGSHAYGLTYRAMIAAAPALPQQGEKDNQFCELCSGINGHHESVRCPAYNSNQPEQDQLCQLSDEDILNKVPRVLCTDISKTEGRYRQGFIDFARSLLSSRKESKDV